MPAHMQNEIEKLKKRILSLCATVETNLWAAVRSIAERDSNRAQEVIQNDSKIDNMEIDVEEDCLKILALHQPVAVDLRFIVAVLKINNDLERIGDLAVNIAERAAYLADKPPVNMSFDFVDMAEKVQTMLKNSLDALVNLDTDLAHAVCGADDTIDALNRRVYLEVEKATKKNFDQIPSLLHLLSVSRHLERIADHATNIAEDVIYMVDGRITRHKTESYK
ncbi:MAG TPA: phosphate signaling complex protein PhoU [Planctomycetes bacterium]|nr:phosphate signaling complex protein PhoU [Planctomycetota bacterium]HIJ72139.1 phosphate signaling complex protein PhoU [Planctomycetota bacterium]